VPPDAATATLTLGGEGSPSPDLVLTAASAGAWGNRLSATVDRPYDCAIRGPSVEAWQGATAAVHSAAP